jgi:hypothetical protein
MTEQKTVDDVAVATGDASEPLRGRALYTSVAGAIVGAAVSFGLPLTHDQQGAAAVLLALAAPQVVAWWARRHVNSPATMHKVLNRVR